MVLDEYFERQINASRFENAWIVPHHLKKGYISPSNQIHIIKIFCTKGLTYPFFWLMRTIRRFLNSEGSIYLSKFLSMIKMDIYFIKFFYIHNVSKLNKKFSLNQNGIKSGWINNLMVIFYISYLNLRYLIFNFHPLPKKNIL